MTAMINNIKDYIHRFKIDEEEIEIIINFKEGKWSHKIIKGDTGMSGSSGGVYKSLNEYIKEEEREHRYTYYFFKYGYKYAKTHINDSNPNF